MKRQARRRSRNRLQMQALAPLHQKKIQRERQPTKQELHQIQNHLVLELKMERPRRSRILCLRQARRRHQRQVRSRQQADRMGPALRIHSLKMQHRSLRKTQRQIRILLLGPELQIQTHQRHCLLQPARQSQRWVLSMELRQIQSPLHLQLGHQHCPGRKQVHRIPCPQLNWQAGQML
jgi:hypothetical protein